MERGPALRRVGPDFGLQRWSERLRYSSWITSSGNDPGRWWCWAPRVGVVTYDRSRTTDPLRRLTLLEALRYRLTRTRVLHRHTGRTAP